MIHFFEITNIAFTVIGYPISYVELIGTLFGFISVFYATKANILTWSTGIVNELFLFILFFQVQLYADMFLQIYFFIVTIFGWYNWNKVAIENKIETIHLNARWLTALIIIVGCIFCGIIIKNIHLYLPSYFKVPASYPFSDSLVMVLSIIATVLLAKKKIENWYLWLLVDAICVILYFKKGVYFLSIEYLVFFALAYYGLHQWKKQLAND